MEKQNPQCVISKEYFCTTIASIQEQDEINRKFSEALSTVGDGHFVFGVENKYHRALMDLLAVITGDAETEYISWWLYESGDKKVWLEDGTEIPLETPEQLYDFLLDNMAERDSGGTNG